MWPGFASKIGLRLLGRVAGICLTKKKNGRRLLGRVAGISIKNVGGDSSAVWPGFASTNWANYANCVANAMLVHLGQNCLFCEPVHAVRFTRFTLLFMPG